MLRKIEYNNNYALRDEILQQEWKFQRTTRYIQNLNRDLSGVMSLLDVNFNKNTTESTTQEEDQSEQLLTT